VYLHADAVAARHVERSTLSRLHGRPMLMHAVLTGQFVDRLEPLRSFHGQLERELGPVSGAFL
jgi:hypothetical protein